MPYCAHVVLQDAPIDNRRMLYEHIVISGGSTMYPGAGGSEAGARYRVK